MEDKEKGFDLAVFEFRESLVKAINESTLPITVKSAVVNELSMDLNQLKNQVIQQQKKEYESKTLKEGD